MSFTWTNGNSKKIHDSDKIVSETTASGDEVIITYEKPDVCNLNYLGEIKATEKFLFFNNNGLKSNTIAELKKQASDIGGSIVYVYTDLQNGFAIGFTRIVSACVFKK
ncbi:MAG: hypothetical protein CVU11_07755 [Bacteroidetes bacterium HGW-Bacteroidetes-6]|nr:MAG: hypothetical protein CVU11_07755 [Bacteroidetes bacterium HGW-Bacteroidetes-6]